LLVSVRYTHRVLNSYALIPNAWQGVSVCLITRCGCHRRPVLVPPTTPQKWRGEYEPSGLPERNRVLLPLLPSRIRCLRDTRTVPLLP